ncbi:MAG: Rne/Rng family ribonuclease, partial [Kordiimonadaceae bacterium]|nr:Rne/Rng family ribonuclease [Kordiimonadaceae bacterium]
FDYESSAKKQLKGSIYLAKVTRVEPSLQAAFVDYGGNRHGFLAFSEIHPDYYQIPVADREALIAAEAAANAKIFAEEEEKHEKRAARNAKKSKSVKAEATKSDDVITDDDSPEEENSEEKTSEEVTTEEDTSESEVSEENAEEKTKEADTPSAKETDDEEDDDDASSNTSEEEEEEKLRIKMAKRLRYKYKIQEVIKKNQIILIQVVKEERGNKGAALTTYLSLPGRYCVLMPNTLHGGGVSRKIANVKDRKKLKNILSSLNMPKGHACIIRTAGNNRTKPEITRDYDYLKRMWEAIREHTLKSIAPSLIYEEGDLIKRSIRDLYTRDIGEILVEGEFGYNTAKDFMGMLMPQHMKKIHHYDEQIPLFQRYQVETHLDSMYSPTAQLKSGGYIVINPTEALVSIDVNSGRATKEHNIEETAVKTNLEAAAEIARQLKLRDMAGLVVIDFIDMEDNRNNRAVERKMKACLKADRARIQVGRISSFGLMEMSRQRLRVGVLESSTNACPHCEGSGVLRSEQSQSLHILRIIEEEGIRAKNSKFTVYLPSSVAVYILNNKRSNLLELEKRYDFSVTIAIDNELTASAHRMEKSGKPSRTAQKRKDSLELGKDVNKLIDVTEEDVSPVEDKEERNERPKRRRRRRKNQYNKNADRPEQQTETSETQDQDQNDQEVQSEQSDETKDTQNRQRPRRPRRNRRYNKDKPPYDENKDGESSDVKPEVSAPEKSVENKTEQAPEAEKPKRAPRRPRKPRVISDDVKPDDVKAEDTKKAAPKKAKAEKPKEDKPAAVKPKADKPADDKPKKKGWWSRAMS